MSWQTLNHARLEGDHVVMRPIMPADREELAEIAFDPDIWRYFVARVESQADLDRFIEAAVDDTAAQRRIVFVIVDKATGRIAGSTAYGNLAEADRRIEIGWSWVSRNHRGRGLNGWAKYLLLSHGFETLGCERIEFKTDVLNLQARKGLRNIGATEEGVLRSYNYMPGGQRRDAVYFSILKSEWSAIRPVLEQGLKLAHPAAEVLVS